MRNYLHSLSILSLCTMFLLGGCTYPSSKTTFAVAEQQEQEKVQIDATAILKQAVETTTHAEEKDQKFWFQGYIKNGIGERTTTSMYDGVAIRPKEAYIVNGRMAGIPFNYYRWEDRYYIKKGNMWFKASKEETLPYDPFAGFLDWLPLMKKAYQLPDQEVLSQLCEVIQVETNGLDWVAQSSSPLFADLKNKLDEKSLQHVLKNTVVKSTLWIGKEDHYIYQCSTWLVMPLPGAGYVDQETYFRFYKYGDPGIEKEIQSPEKLEQWVREAEELIKSGDYEELPENNPQQEE